MKRLCVGVTITPETPSGRSNVGAEKTGIRTDNGRFTLAGSAITMVTNVNIRTSKVLTQHLCN